AAPSLQMRARREVYRMCPDIFSPKRVLGLLILTIAVAFSVCVCVRQAVDAQGQIQIENNVWRADESKFEIDTLKVKPTKFAAFTLDATKLNEILRSAPKEFTPDARARTVIIPLPLPTGRVGRFRLQESSIMAPKLAERFPWVKSYSVKGLDDRTATG